MAKLNREWIVPPHGRVERLDDGLLTVAGEIVMPLGRFPRRMTVIALKGGRSAIWSAIPLREPEMKQVEALGKPSFLIVPNPAHRLDAAAWLARYPEIEVVCPPGAREKVEEAVPVTHTADPFRDPDVTLSIVAGLSDDEAALAVWRSGRLSLVLNDVLANVRHPRGLGAKIMARLFGFGVDRPRTPRVVKRVFVKDRSALAAQFRRWAAAPGLERVIVSHGDVIDRRPRIALERAAKDLDA